MVRIQVSSWAVFQDLIFTNQQYYASITLHAIRALFLFAMPSLMLVLSYITVKLYGLEARKVNLLWIGWVLNEIIAAIFWEGPIIFNSSAFDSYFSATMWYFLAPIGLPYYSNYVVSPFWYFAWLLHFVFVYLWVYWEVYHLRLALQKKRKLDYVGAFILSSTLIIAIGYLGVTFSTSWLTLSWISSWLSNPPLIPVNSLINQVFFWVFGHAVVYMAFVPALTLLYYLVPLISGKKIYSERAAIIAAFLYLIASPVVPLHHLYLTPLPDIAKDINAFFTYLVVVPSVMTVFNLWATATRDNGFKWNVPSAFVALSFYAILVGGVTGIINGDPTSAPIIHNTEWVPAHFHTMIWAIVSSATAGLYILIPTFFGRAWYSIKMAWFHFFLTAVSIIGMNSSWFLIASDQAFIRRAETFPITPSSEYGTVFLTAFAILYGIAQLIWVINIVNTAFSGRRFTGEMSVSEVLETTLMTSLRGGRK
jgi:terminal oxidase heme-binding subunit I